MSLRNGIFFLSLMILSVLIQANPNKLDHPSELNYLIEKANQGQPNAQFELANFYLNQNEPDQAKAHKWFRLAASQDHVLAQEKLAENLAKSPSSQNKQESVKWYIRAARLGSAQAQLVVGDMYFQGKGLPVNYEQAIYWYQQAKDNHNIEAYYALGLVYSEQKAKHRNFKKAFEYFLTAAQYQHAAAQVAVATAYEKGYGVKKDLRMAYKWYHSAARLNHPRAQYKVGLALAKGNGVTKDLPHAAAWLEKAGENGSRLSDIYQKKLKRKVSAEQLAQARQDVWSQTHEEVS